MPRPGPSPLYRAAWAVKSRLHNRFRRRLLVLKCERPADSGEGPAAAVSVVAYGPGDERPAPLTDALARNFGAGFAKIDAAARAEGATLWVAVDGEEPVAFVRSRPGDAVANWHEGLGPSDRLVYAMATHRRARCRGIGTTLLRAAVGEVPEGGAAWADTMRWNGPALTALRKAGFRPLYEAPPLPDHPDCNPAGGGPPRRSRALPVIPRPVIPPRVHWGSAVRRRTPRF